MTQQELASELVVNRGAIIGIENGSRSVDSLELLSIAEATDCGVDTLLAGQPSLPLLSLSPESVNPCIRGEIAWVEQFMINYAFLKRLVPE